MQYCIIGYSFYVHHKIINKESETPYYKKKRKGENANMQKKNYDSLIFGIIKICNLDENSRKTISEQNYAIDKDMFKNGVLP